MIVFALATFGCSLPHFIYGDELLLSNNVFYGGASSGVATPLATSNPLHNASGIDALDSNIHPMAYSNLCRSPDSNFTDSGSKWMIISHYNGNFKKSP